MKRTHWILTAALILGMTGATLAQSDLSSQVLRLLVRDNFWSGLNVFARTKGVTLEAGLVPPVATTDTLYNVGGNLYFNGNLIPGAIGAGTVTSVGLVMPGIFTVTNSPVSGVGNLTATLNTQTANLVWAGPGTGAAAAPTFRALVDADVPDTITIAGTNNVTWASVNKATSSLADLATRSATDLTSGTLPDLRFPATLPAASGVNLTALNATNLGSGTVPAARMPALTGDITSTVGTVATTLANTTVAAGTYGSGSLVPVITVDAKGRLTTVTTTATVPGGTTPVANGGTNITTYTIGDLLYASAAGVLSKLADVAMGNVLLSGGVGANPAYGKVTLTGHVSGILPPANGGVGVATVPTNGQIPIGNGTTYVAASILGTASQITVTVGAGSITLSTPQGIATTSTPQFARLGLGTGAGGTAVITTTGIFDVGLYDNGNSGANQTITWANGMVQKTTLTASVTFTFQTPVAAGTWFTLELIQGGVGSFLANWPGDVVWDAATAPTLSTAVGGTDICSFFWDGSKYYGRCIIGT